MNRTFDENALLHGGAEMIQALVQLNEACCTSASHLDMIRKAFPQATHSEKKALSKQIGLAISQAAHQSRAFLRAYDHLLAKCSTEADNGD
jgi:hypothetical protein